MVVNTVLIANLNTAMEAMQNSNFDAEVVQIQISRGKRMPWSSRLSAENPVWIISGKRKDL
jgi:precorrin-6Y C5,15-methyltransferase (decarboxylating)